MILLQNAIFGLLIGGLYGLGAVGLSLVFGVLRMLNVSHGELIMLGGYASFWLFTLWRGDPVLSMLVAGPALFLVGGLLFPVLFPPFLHFSQGPKNKKSLFVGFLVGRGLLNLAHLALGAG